jgi:DNA-binding MarR family transcriptional regulator
MFPQKLSMSANTPSTTAPLEAHLGFWLRFVSNHVSARFAVLLEAKDVTVTEWVALRTLLAQGESSHAALIAALGMTKGAASKVVSRLESKALARRLPSAHSGREQVLVLTPKGKALVPKLAQLADANEEHFFAHLPAKERQALMRTLQALVQHHQFTEVPTA